MINLKEFLNLKKNFMKLLAKKIFNSNLFLFLRNNFNIKKNKFGLFNIKKNISVSDSFCWRTDNNFETIFRFSDILKNFYKIDNSKVKIIFYNRFGKIIKEIEIKNLNQSNNEFLVNKEFLNGLEDYGTFHIYHKLKNFPNHKTIISNRCYLGFSKKNALPSFMHGNTYSSYVNINDDSKKHSNIVKNKIFIDSFYKIQNYFDDYDKTELFFSNPTDNKIKFFLNNKFYELETNSSLVIKSMKEKTFTIRSNCLFLRPVVFNYRNDFLDVFHA